MKKRNILLIISIAFILTGCTTQYNLEIDYMDSTVDDYIDPNDAIEPDEHTIVIKTGINIDTAPSYYGIKIVFRKSN